MEGGDQLKQAMVLQAAAASTAEQKFNILRLTLILDNVVDEIIQHWRGREREIDLAGNETWTVKGKPVMKEELVLDLKSLMKQIGSRLVTLSSYTEYEAYFITQYIMYDVNDLLLDKCIEADLDLDEWQNILNKVGEFIFAALMQAKDGKTREYAFTTTERKEIDAATQAPSFMNELFRQKPRR